MNINFFSVFRQVLLTGILMNVARTAKAQHIYIPNRSFPDYFTYHKPTNPAMPSGSDTAGNSTIFYLMTYLSGPTTETTRLGTMFLINTFRDDDTICACLTGHQMAGHFYPDVPQAGASFNKNIELYFNFLGEDSLSMFNGNQTSFNRTLSYSKSIITGGRLAGYYFNPNDIVGYPDIALVLIDKRQLLVNNIFTAPYTFANDAWTGGRLYNLHHTAGYPRRIQDYLSISDNSGSQWKMFAQYPYGIGHGGSGSPLIQNNSLTALDWYVRGVVSHAHFADTLKDAFTNNDVMCGPYIGVTRINTMQQEIKQHCWKNKTEAEILTGKLHQKPIVIDNTANTTLQNVTVSSAAAVASRSTYSGPLKKRILSSYMKAGQCVLNGFTLPTVYPGTTNGWNITIAAKEANLTDFEYWAADTAELNIETVRLAGVSTISGYTQAKPAIGQPADGQSYTGQLNVYPNPSSNGQFTIEWPQTTDVAPYTIQVFSADGRLIYERSVPGGNNYKLDLSRFSSGTYLLVLKNSMGKTIWSQPVVY